MFILVKMQYINAISIFVSNCRREAVCDTYLQSIILHIYHDVVHIIIQTLTTMLGGINKS